jgi:ABC-type branched-subunit amino acid transport system ATPase component
MPDASLWALCLSDISKAFGGLLAVDGVSLQVADYVHVLSRGRIVHSSVPEALWHNQEVKARYLGM